ncbi:MAG: hypothetical protein AAGD07_25395 [Planctomycetota bacterium]
MKAVHRVSWIGAICLVGVLVTQSCQAMEAFLDKLPDSRLRNNVVRAVDQFRVKEDKAKRDFLQAIQNYEMVVKRGGLGLAAQEQLEMVQDVRKWLITGGTLPRCEELFPALIQYRQAVAKARDTVVRPAQALAKSLNNDGQEGLAIVLFGELDRLGDVLNTGFTLKAGSKWSGYRKHVKTHKRQYSLRFRFDKREAYQLLGTVENQHQYSGHPKYQLLGKLDGANVQLQTGKRLALQGGKDGTFTYTGYVIGRTIVGEFAGRQVDGKLGNGYFRVDLVD